MADKLFDDFNKEIDTDSDALEKVKFEDDESEDADENVDNREDDNAESDYDEKEDDAEDIMDREKDDGDDKMKEKKEKPKKSFGKKIKHFFITIIVLIILIAVALGVLLKLGVDDLQDDENYLLVVQNKDVAKAGTLYNMPKNEDTIINIEPFPSLNKLSDFYGYASSSNQIDRLLVFDTSVIRKYSGGNTFEFRGQQIEINMFIKFLTGEEPIPAELRQDDAAEWETRSHMLGDWVDEFHGNIFASVWYNFKQLAGDYRTNSVMLYPSNSALFIVKFIPIEKVF